MDTAEVLRHVRAECAQWLSAPGNDVPQHELDRAVEELLPTALAGLLSNAMTCAALAEPYFDARFKDAAQKQLWNW